MGGLFGREAREGHREDWLMFTKDGYLSPSETIEQLFTFAMKGEHGKDIGNSEGDSDLKEIASAFGDAERGFASLMRRLRRAEVMLPNGNTVTVDGGFLSNVFSASPFNHCYFNWRTGEIGPPSIDFILFVKKQLVEAAMNLINPALLRKKDIRWFSVFILAFVVFISFLAATMKSFSMFSAQQGFHKIAIAADILIPFLLCGLGFVYLFFKINSRARRAVGCYKGGHLIIRKEVVDAWAKTYFSHSDSTFNFSDELSISGYSDDIKSLTSSEEICARAIVQAHDIIVKSGGTKIRISEAKNRFAHLVSSDRAFERAWSMARQERPEIGRGGRPKTPS
jgi:hypothetical protein